MTTPKDANQPITTADLTWDDNGQPLSNYFGDVYFSRHNGLAETQHVFLQHNHLAQRFSQCTSDTPFTIGETGFGSGLNFLAAWQLWQQTAPSLARLHFVSVERFPLSHGDLVKALSLWPQLQPLAQQLIAAYPKALYPGVHRLGFGPVSLTLILDEAAAGFTQLLASHHPDFDHGFAGFAVDAWFLDGFAPAKNPDMWRPELFASLARLSRLGTTLATFTAAGVVKRGLQAVGFDIEKVPGFGKKREMIRAVRSNIKATPEPPLASPLAWQAGAKVAAPVTTVAVIGAGLAGCHTAAALARRGVHIHLYDRHPAPAQEASGNPQGVVYAKLSPQPGNQGDFNCLALLYAQRHYQSFWDCDTQDFGDQCGVLQLANEKQVKTYTAIAKRLGQQGLVHWLNHQQTQQQAGVTTSAPGLWFPQSGWLYPQKVCAELIRPAAVTSFYNTEIGRLEPLPGHHQCSDQPQWRLANTEGQHLGDYHSVVVACANQARVLSPTAHLPLKPVRGQVSLVPATKQSRQLSSVVCSEGYIAPSYLNDQGLASHCLGATFDPKSCDMQPRREDQRRNLDAATAMLPEINRQWPREVDNWSARVALRATSPDYLPLVGPVADVPAMETAFASLRKNARQAVASPGHFLPGLYANLGHGSRGLTYTPLCAELLAAHLLGEPPPLGFTLNQALHPARFIIRELIRNQR
ncbi:bifunctional tRNA (5-methylaminomethyl-2-thiouridine)(34)-methyltransferase MnmD/FAD-dependent 5-carboxymethylaminomethyl-2-thiouridine(34) oxidoreductase MnmC [Halioxenophilus aromaticivorans]|uniref:tRNA 5-methylaminomethyl-2-thiouridine biosynthesis bifunctional protein MnmC n=1 Tax=Halioxenophilus aromaticivorans TaxID=1306992 RepID=A0AAV3U6N0_9ALTE